MQTWMRFGIGVAAIALAIAAGTAAYAMRDGSDDPARQATAGDGAANPEAGDEQDTSAGAFAAMCAAEQPDCDDTVDTAARCTPEFPDCDDTIGAPIGDFAEYPCAADDIGCVNSSNCVTILPAPVDEPIVSDPAVSGPAVDLPIMIDNGEGGAGEAAPELTEEELAHLEDMKAREQTACESLGECVPGPAVDCGAVDACVPGPAVDCGPVDCVVGPDGACLAPDCAISSDGAVACPPSEPCILPAPDLPEETTIERCSAGCSSPGFDPDAPQDDPATDPAVRAPEGAFPCPVDPSAGGGTDGSQHGNSGVVEPAPVE